MSRSANRYMLIEKQEKWKIGIYGRISRKERGRDSLDNQIDYVKAKCELELMPEIVKVYREEGVSGRNMNRPVLGILWNEVVQNEINCIAVKDLSRIGRNYIDVNDFLDLCINQKCRVIAFDDKFDSLKNRGEMHKNIELINILNEFYARDYSRKIRQAKQQAKSQGEYVGSLPPFGYQITKTEKGRFLEKDEKTAKYVEQLFCLFASGMGYNDLVRWLCMAGINPIRVYQKTKILVVKNGGKAEPWSVSSIKSILSNPRYKDDIVGEKIFDSVQGRMRR